MNLDELRDIHKNSELENINALDVRISNEYYNRIIVVEYACVLLSVFGIAMSIVLNELSESRDISLENQ